MCSSLISTESKSIDNRYAWKAEKSQDTGYCPSKHHKSFEEQGQGIIFLLFLSWLPFLAVLNQTWNISSLHTPTDALKDIALIYGKTCWLVKVDL
jgi:hypothetical protein